MHISCPSRDVCHINPQMINGFPYSKQVQASRTAMRGHGRWKQKCQRAETALAKAGFSSADTRLARERTFKTNKKTRQRIFLCRVVCSGLFVCGFCTEVIGSCSPACCLHVILCNLGRNLINLMVFHVG